MSERPTLTLGLKRQDFLEYYYLKEELIKFCHDNGLPAFGGKQELTERIAYYLDTGKIKNSSGTASTKRKAKITTITEASKIEENIICSEVHRAFFKSKIGESFSFNVTFQKWLKANSGKTYSDAIDAYYEIKRTAKQGQTVIGKQFEYNTYIRDFFADNKGASLDDAIRCWKYKKGDGSVSGILLYAKTADEQPLDQTYHMSGNTITVKTLDLNQDFSKIRETLDRIAQIAKA